jgi:hypothetical protein
MMMSYQKIQAPNADYFQLGCLAELAPRTMVYYPFHGIYVSIDLRSHSFGLHIPQGFVVNLDGRNIVVNGSRRFTYEANLGLRAIPHPPIGTSDVPAQFMQTVDHYTAPDNYGPLQGGGEGKYLLWYKYLLYDPKDPQGRWHLPKGLAEGTIEVPAMTINGQRYDPQILFFKRESLFGLAAVNC